MNNINKKSESEIDEIIYKFIYNNWNKNDLCENFISKLNIKEKKQLINIEIEK